MNSSRAAVAFHRLSAANPVPLEAIDSTSLVVPELSPRRDQGRGDRRRRGRIASIAFAAALALVTVAPTMAISERMRELFGLSNPGEQVPTSTLALDQVSDLQRIGVVGGVRKLGQREGTAFYVGRSRSGELCFVTGAAAATRPVLGMLACQGEQGLFPSPKMPIADFSPMRGHEGRNSVYVWKLAGFAADGVAAVAVRDATGVLRSIIPATDNMYASGELPAVAATAIVALAADGTVLYSKEVASSTPG